MAVWVDLPQCPYGSKYWKGCICNACIATRRRKQYKWYKKRQKRAAIELQSRRETYTLNAVPVVLKYEDLVPPHRQALISFGLKFTGNLATSEDLVQDTMVRAFTFWPQFAPTTEDTSRDVLVWLRRILSNIFYSQCLKEKKRTEGVQEYTAYLHLGDNEDTEFIGKTRALLEKLKPIYKEVVELHYIDGLSYQEMADKLAIPFTKVQKRLWRARNAMRELISVAGIVNPSTVKAPQSEQTEPDAVQSVMRDDDTSDFLVSKSTSYTTPAR